MVTFDQVSLPIWGAFFMGIRQGGDRQRGTMSEEKEKLPQRLKDRKKRKESKYEV